MLDLKALLQVPYVEPFTGFDISPDGRKVAFSWNKTGYWEIYELSLTDRQTTRKISIGPGGKFASKYSPDGRYLAYAVDLDGSESFHLFVHEFAYGRTVDLTPDIPYALQPNFAWSPDSREIAFLADKEGCFNAYILSVCHCAEQSDESIPILGEETSATSEVSRFHYNATRHILAVGRPCWDVKWSPDGAQLAVIVEGTGQDFHTYLVSPDGKMLQAIAEDDNPIDANSPAWSPDGKRLAFSSSAHGHRNVGIYELETARLTWLDEVEEERDSPAWSPDQERLVFVASKGAATWLEIWREGGKTVETAPTSRRRRSAPTEDQLAQEGFALVSPRFESPDFGQPGLHYLPAFTPDGDSVVFIFENPCHPDDLWQWSLQDNRFQQLTDSLTAELKTASIVMPQEVVYPGMDGTPVPALLYRPPQADPQKRAVILIHGGPDWHFSFTWYPLAAHLASRGWTVLAPNYRGSTGYGRDWQLANRFDLGGIDTDDVAAGAQYLIVESLADPRHIAVTGRSHGGYLTMSCLTRYPELWAAGSSVVPFFNWFTAHVNSREDLQHWDIENLGDPVENHDLWHERSPFFFLDRVRVPVQLICGANDPRCPASESIQARDMLQSLGKDVELVLYPGEGHTFLDVKNVVDSELRRVEFLARELEGPPSVTSEQ
jgi:dipeptidyl aminopeptidase/acylaminoacyl peptidase